MRSLLTVLALILLMTGSLAAQSRAALISYRYDDTPLYLVMDDLEQRYRLRFSYSRDFLPLDHPLTARASALALRPALDRLFAAAPIRYALIGDQVVLRYEARPVQQERISMQPPPAREAPEVAVAAVRLPREVPAASSPVATRTAPRHVPGGRSVLDTAHELQPWAPPIARTTGPDLKLAQVSLVPYIGSNEMRSERTINHLSLNVIGGINGGVQGVEIGGMFNVIRGKVEGIQLAGLGNYVEGPVYGLQLAGLVNYNRRSVRGIQLAGLANINHGAFNGIQLGGLFNAGPTEAGALQLAGVFNRSHGKVDTQVAGLFNVAGDVYSVQVGPLFNSARTVWGHQVGLVNVSDSISGLPLGLLNIVRKGYNRIDFGAGDLLYANVSARLGAHRLYNIFHLGARWDELERTGAGGETVRGTFMSWALGYGFGFTSPLGRSALLNYELVGMHLNEYASWTRPLNLLGQLRLTLEATAGRGVHFYVGPVFNTLASKITDPATGEPAGSSLPGHTLWEGVVGQTHLQAWVGFQAGIRFGR